MLNALRALADSPTTDRTAAVQKAGSYVPGGKVRAAIGALYGAAQRSAHPGGMMLRCSLG
jgi:hypothetical protein